MITIAFHGWGAWPNLLKEDMGDLSSSVDHFFKGHDLMKAIDFCSQFKSVNLIGYSLGGGLIADLSCSILNINKAVLYESCLGKYDMVYGYFPVMIIWNKKGRKNWKAAREMEAEWNFNNRKVEYLEGNGRHFSFKPKIMPFRHAWDCSLNEKIKEFLERA